MGIVVARDFEKTMFSCFRGRLRGVRVLIGFFDWNWIFGIKLSQRLGWWDADLFFGRKYLWVVPLSTKPFLAVHCFRMS